MKIGGRKTFKRPYLMFVKICPISRKVSRSNARIEWNEKRKSNYGHNGEIFVDSHNEKLLKKVFKLKGTNLSLSEQFSKEI